MTKRKKADVSSAFCIPPFFLLIGLLTGSQVCWGKFDILDELLPRPESGEALSQEQREAIQNYKRDFSKKMRKMLFQCIERKQEPLLSGPDEVLKECGLWEMCLLAGEETPETKKKPQKLLFFFTVSGH